MLLKITHTFVSQDKEQKQHNTFLLFKLQVQKDWQELAETPGGLRPPRPTQGTCQQ